MRNELLRKRKEARHLWKDLTRRRKRVLRLERIIKRYERAMERAASGRGDDAGDSA